MLIAQCWLFQIRALLIKDGFIDIKRHAHRSPSCGSSWMISTSRTCSIFLHFLGGRAGTSLSSQESCTRRLFLRHMKDTGSQQRKLGAAIHAPFDQFEPVHMPDDAALDSKAARVLQPPPLCRVGFLWQTTSTRGSGSLLPN